MTRTEAERIRLEAAKLIASQRSGWPDPYNGPPFVVVTEQVRERHAGAARVLRVADDCDLQAALRKAGVVE